MNKIGIYYPEFIKVSKGNYKTSFNMKEFGIEDVSKINEVLLATREGNKNQDVKCFDTIGPGVVKDIKKSRTNYGFAAEINQIMFGEEQQFILNGSTTVDWETGQVDISLDHMIPIAIIIRTLSNDEKMQPEPRQYVKAVNYDKIPIDEYDILISQISDMIDTLLTNDKYSDRIRALHSDLLLELSVTLSNIGVDKSEEDPSQHPILKKIPIGCYEDILKDFMGIYLETVKVDPTTVYTHRSAVDLFTKYIYLNFKKDEEEKEDE